MKHRNDIDYNARLYGKQKFSLRKLSVGLVAVTLGTTFYLTNGQLVHADEASTSQTENQVVKVQKEAAPDINGTKPESNEEQSAETPTGKGGNQTGNVNDLAKPDNKNVNPLKDNKTAVQETVSIEAHEIDANHNQDINKPVKSSMMAGQDNASVDIKINHPKINSNKQLIISFPQAGDDNSGKAYKLNVKIGESDFNGDESGHWHLDTEADKIIATWVLGNPQIESNPTSLNLSIPVQGNKETVKTDYNNQTFQVQIGSQTYNVFTTNLIPYKDKVREGEILKGFKMVGTTVAGDRGNISDEDYSKYDLSDNQKLNQWGIYFNYGSRTQLIPLMNAVFKTLFSNDQIMLPSSIRVFEVPDSMAVDDSGYRHGEDDTYIDPKNPNDPTQRTTFYSQITKYENYRPAFQKFLTEHLTFDAEGKPNGFAVDQANDSNFHIGNDDTYSKHAYFIQIDAVMKNKNGVPGDGTSITTSQTLSGKGQTPISETISWTGTPVGGGQGQNQTENAHVRFYDNTEGKFIDDAPTLDATGVDTTAISFNDLVPNYNSLVNKHYNFVNITKGQEPTGNEISTNIAKPNFGNYDTDPTVDQNFVIHFTHQTVKETQTANVKETVNYKYENGPLAGQTFTKANLPTIYNHDRDVTYERTNTTDLVTGQTTSSNWQQKGIMVSFDEYTYADALPGRTENATPGNIYKIDRAGITTNNSDKSGVITEYDQSKDGRLNIDTSKMVNGQTYTYTISVPYKLTESIMVHFIDEDDNNGTEIATSKYTGDPKSTTTNSTSATLEDLKKEGYFVDLGATNGIANSATNPALASSYDYTKLNFNKDSNKYDADKLIFDNDENLNNQQYYIYLHHNIVTDVEEKTITENVKYVDEATGQEIHAPYTSSKLTFSRNIYKDAVTGKITYSSWSVAAFKPVVNPEISGYTIDATKITEKLNDKDSKIADHNAKEIGEADFHKLTDDEITALKDNSELNFVVSYTENPTPDIPSIPTQPTNPSPVHPQNNPDENNTTDSHKHHNTDTVIPKGQYVDENKTSHKKMNDTIKGTHSPISVSHKVASATNKLATSKSELPHTGESQNKLGLIGLAFASLAGILGLASDRKRNNN